MKKLLLILMTVLAGCAAPPLVKINAPFDAKQASIINQVGNNTISGSALVRQAGGGTVTCAGSEVSLTPVTAYASERIMYLYKNTEKGYNNSVRGNFDPDLPEYITLTKKTICNAQGFFTFKNIADGQYFVVTQIRWETSEYYPSVGRISSPQGGYLMRKVTVQGGVTEEIVLAP
jgi:hypothetical protein